MFGLGFLPFIQWWTSDVQCSMFIGYGKLGSRPVRGGGNAINIQTPELPEAKYQE
jgi:hypothetical protein